jgi:hypothetical protein
MDDPVFVDPATRSIETLDQRVDVLQPLEFRAK